MAAYLAGWPILSPGFVWLFVRPCTIFNFPIVFILFECGAKTSNPNTVVLVVGGWWVGGFVGKRGGTSEIEVSEIENGG